MRLKKSKDLKAISTSVDHPLPDTLFFISFFFPPPLTDRLQLKIKVERDPLFPTYF